MTDTERINFLERQLYGSISIRQHEDGWCQGYDPIQVFTVGSQHVYGKTLREAIDEAWGKVRTC